MITLDDFEESAAVAVDNAEGADDRHYRKVVDEITDMSDEELCAVIFDADVPLLRHLELMARGWQTSHPYALVASALGMAISDAPCVRVGTGQMTGSVPLNLALGFVGRSGLGKGVSMGMPIYPYSSVLRPNENARPVDIPGVGGWVADDRSLHAAWGDDYESMSLAPVVTIRKVTPASGEKLVDEFFDQFEVPEDPTAPKGRGRPAKHFMNVQHRDTVWADWAEIDAFFAKAKGRNGAHSGTLEAYIRSIITGERFGDSSITREAQGKPCYVEAPYSAVVTFGVQPTRAAELLNDGGGGTLQRFLYVPIRDDDAVGDEEELLAIRRQLCEELGLAFDDENTDAPPLYVRGPREARLSRDIVRRNMSRRAADLRCETDADYTHGVNLCIRLAAIYGAWQRDSYAPFVIGWREWAWANAFFEVSRRELRNIRRAIATASHQEAAEQGRIDATRTRARDEVMEKANGDRAYRLALQKVASNPGLTTPQLAAKFSKEQRRDLDIADALLRLESDDKVYRLPEGGRDKWFVAEAS